MAEVNPPYVLQASSHPASVLRRTIEDLLAQSGVATSGALAVTANGTPNMTVNVAAGDAFIIGTESALAQGAYHVYNDASVSKSIAAADATNPRNDIVVAKVQDAEYSGATNAWSLAVVTGTPAASPADPTLPANCISLARVRVDALASTIVSGKITDLRTRVAAVGGAPAQSTALVGAGIGQLWSRISNDANEGIEIQNSAGVSRKPWNMPWGLVAAPTTVTLDQSGITTETDITTLTQTNTAVANRYWKITLSIPSIFMAAAGSNTIKITNGSNTEINGRVVSSTSTNWNSDAKVIAYVTTTAGSLTYKGRATAGSAITLDYAATEPGFIMIEDMGPAGAPA